MMTTVLTGQEFAQALEQQKKRHRELEDRRVRANARLEEIKRTHTALAAEIKALFGTDDVAALEKMLAETEAKNAEKLASYTASLESLSLQVTALEEALGMSQGGMPAGAALL